MSPPKPQCDDLAALVSAALAGDERAWAAIVARFAPTVAAVTRRHRLSEADRDDAAQRTWLRLVEQLGAVREPAALGGWLATTAHRECLRVGAGSRRELPVEDPPDEVDSEPLESRLEEDERRAALHSALNRLPTVQRQLLFALVREAATRYGELSARLGMPHGSIGPTRARSLERLRRDPALASAIAA